MNVPTREDWTCRACGLVQHEASPGSRCPDCASVLVPAEVLRAHETEEILGRLVAGKYAVIGILGTGGFGTVYRAIQEPVGRLVALKIVHKQHARDPSLRARFFREARVVAQLSDPVVVTLYDYGDDADVGLYTVFEFVDGATLSARMVEGPQPAVWVTYVLLQLLRGLSEAHSMGMVHRDIKPANIMIVQRPDGDEVVRLLDFGIAKVLAKGQQEATVETQQGVVVGTPEYMSPEQARANRELDARSDIYSLGVVAYTLLTGRNPFRRGSVIDTIMAQCAVEPPPFEPELEVPPLLEAAVFKALDKEPGSRHEDASAMSAALRAVFPPNTVPAGMTPNPSYTSLLASADQRGPTTGSGSRPGPLSGAAVPASDSARASIPEAALDGGSHTMAERVSGVVAAPASDRRPLWIGLVLLLLAGGAGLALLGRGGPDTQAITPAGAPASSTERSRAPSKTEGAAQQAAPAAGAPVDGASDPSASSSAQSGSSGAASSESEPSSSGAPGAEAATKAPTPVVEPAVAEPKPPRRPPRRRPRRRPEPAEKAPEPSPPAQKEPRSIQVPEF